MNFFGKKRPQIDEIRTLFQLLVDAMITERGVPETRVTDVFEYVKTMNVNSVAGFAHIMRLKKQPKITFLVKTARGENANSLVREYEVLKRLNALANRTPNFPVALSLFNCFGDTDADGHLTARICTYPNEHNMTMMVMEYLDQAQTLDDFMGSPGPMGSRGSMGSPEQIFKIILQIYYTLYLAQYYQQFTHYDLHRQNVMVRRIPRQTIEYTMPNNQVFSVDTDVLATIIDFGTSYSSVIPPDLYRLDSQYDTKYGITMNQFNPVVDILKLLAQIPLVLLQKMTPAQQAFIDQIKKQASSDPTRFPWIPQ